MDNTCGAGGSWFNWPSGGSYIPYILTCPPKWYFFPSWICEEKNEGEHIFVMIFNYVYEALLGSLTREVPWSEWGLALSIRIIGSIYFLALVYFLIQHYLVWKREKERVRRAVATFRVLALITLGTTYYLYRYIQEYHPMDLDSPDLTAPTMMFATVQNTFFSKLTKLITMCLLLLLSISRMLRRL